MMSQNFAFNVIFDKSKKLFSTFNDFCLLNNNNMFAVVANFIETWLCHVIPNYYLYQHCFREYRSMFRGVGVYLLKDQNIKSSQAILIRCEL